MLLASGKSDTAAVEGPVTLCWYAVSRTLSAFSYSSTPSCTPVLERTCTRASGCVRRCAGHICCTVILKKKKSTLGRIRSVLNRWLVSVLQHVQFWGSAKSVYELKACLSLKSDENARSLVAHEILLVLNKLFNWIGTSHFTVKKKCFFHSRSIKF